MVNLNLRNIDEYTSRLLGIIKEVYGLRDKAEALNFFAHKFGKNLLQDKLNKDFLKEVQKIEKQHMKKYPNRRMTLKQLKTL